MKKVWRKYREDMKKIQRRYEKNMEKIRKSLSCNHPPGVSQPDFTDTINLINITRFLKKTSMNTVFTCLISCPRQTFSSRQQLRKESGSPAGDMENTLLI